MDIDVTAGWILAAGRTLVVLTRKGRVKKINCFFMSPAHAKQSRPLQALTAASPTAAQYELAKVVRLASEKCQNSDF